MDSVRERKLVWVGFQKRFFFLFRVNREPVSGVEYTVPNLVDGKEYEFRVAAVNKAGPGEFGMNFPC